MNRTSITGLACLLAVALTACAGGGEPPAPSGSPASAPLEALKEPANSMSVSASVVPSRLCRPRPWRPTGPCWQGSRGRWIARRRGWSCTRSPCPRRRSWSMCCWIWTGTAGGSWWCRW
ncbi:MAG: hypothetical protein ACLRWQ_02605 [Flavonifractor plautii]